MNALKRFEELMESAVEGSLTELSTGHLQPVEIAKKLARAMDSGQAISAGQTLAPNDYTVRVSSADFTVFAPFRRSLERSLAAYLSRLARERGLSFVRPPRVVVEEEARLRPRRIRIAAETTDGAVATPAPTTVEFTARLPVADVQEKLAHTAQLLMPEARKLTLDGTVTSLGRQLDNDIVVEDRRVSRHHAQIRFEHRNFCLYDLASANGTSVNGQPIQQVVLRDGDLISLGGVELTFRHQTAEVRRGA